jgi:hypothetical protein
MLLIPNTDYLLTVSGRYPLGGFTGTRQFCRRMVTYGTSIALSSVQCSLVAPPSNVVGTATVFTQDNHILTIGSSLNDVSVFNRVGLDQYLRYNGINTAISKCVCQPETTTTISNSKCYATRDGAQLELIKLNLGTAPNELTLKSVIFKGSGLCSGLTFFATLKIAVVCDSSITCYAILPEARNPSGSVIEIFSPVLPSSTTITSIYRITDSTSQGTFVVSLSSSNDMFRAQVYQIAATCLISANH